MKFLHIADVHIGCWRNKAMRSLSVKAFEEVCSVAVNEDVDFVVLSGDLFHTALPSINFVKQVFKNLRKLKEERIRLYYIAGSHDYSPTGKTMLDIIEEADLGVNVTKGQVREDGVLKLQFVEDKGTRCKLTGIAGKAGMLDQKDYYDLDRAHLEDVDGKKIFLFHTALDELLTKELSAMSSSSASFLPKGFEYYAGGHVHIQRDIAMEDYQNVVYPGPLFPTTFKEIEELEEGRYVLYEDGEVTHKTLQLKPVVSKSISFESTSPENIFRLVKEAFEGVGVEDSIVTIRLKGDLVGGSIGDIDFNTVYTELLERGAYHVMRSTAGISTESFDAEVVGDREQEEIEKDLIAEHSGQIETRFADEEKVTKNLFKDWNVEKQEGETNSEYEDRVIGVADTIMTSSENASNQNNSEEKINKEADKESDLTSFME